MVKLSRPTGGVSVRVAGHNGAEKNEILLMLLGCQCAMRTAHEKSVRTRRWLSCA
jgi:hypothetical protein